MQLDPALLMEDCTPSVHEDLEMESQTSSCGESEPLDYGHLVEEQLAAELLLYLGTKML